MTTATATQKAVPRATNGIMAATRNNTVTVELVTPAIATAWLEANTKNRPVNDGRVEMYARDMTAGNWKLSNDAIAFAVDGSLMNGQHRLWAVINSGCAAQFVVMRNVEEETRGIMDLGQRRSNGQNYALLTGDKAGKKKMEVANYIRQLTDNTSEKCTYQESADLVEKYGEAIEWAFALSSPPGKLRAAFVRGPLAFARRTNEAAVEEFAARLFSGAGLDDGEPALILRNKLLFSDIQRHNRRGLGVCVLRAIAAHINGERIRALFATEDAVAYFGKAWGLKLKGSSKKNDAGGVLRRRAKGKAK